MRQGKGMIVYTENLIKYTQKKLLKLKSGFSER